MLVRVNSPWPAPHQFLEVCSISGALGGPGVRQPGCGGRGHLSGLSRVEMHLSPQVRLLRAGVPV